MIFTLKEGYAKDKDIYIYIAALIIESSFCMKIKKKL